MVLGIRGIEESSVYQSIFAKGKAEGEAKGKAEGIAESLLRLGRKRLGPPGEGVEGAITGISDRERLLQLLDRVVDASSWEELLASSES